MPTALVTGASGFTGRYMVAALQQRSFKVIGLGSKPSPADVMIPCDLTDPAAVKAAVSQAAPDWVIHLAALSFVEHADQQAFYQVNVFGTLNLLQALSELEKPPSRVLIASSANVYGIPDISRITEKECPTPVNHYACSKLAMEHMVANFFECLPIVITRPFNYTGPGQDSRFLIPKIVEHFARGDRTIELGNIDVSRDFSDVRDLISAYLSLLESDVSGTTVNVCSGKDTALRTIIERMNHLAGYNIEVKVNPAFVRANEIPRLCGVNDRLKNLTGWQPNYTLEQTLLDTFKSAKARNIGTQ
ncbi:GDP-mannose 4,6-dehydratase [Oceanimonas pelagia]|uniref:GDP-mannose 4,6-dehydratase n=1 Tax=Oceanimonas pelagia TaxID=3028314 RepID=A0AA50KKI8_9GAMM|nr:GDP-mannose 4,6-dehydratase [Oceanimonas pelagia]WMC09224.1 GDP-mannose 4,6-dehydratase [Oceanimonas pelagia]